MEKEKKMIILSVLLAAFSGVALPEGWKATIVKRLDTLVGSCVVVPCTFSHPKGNLPSSRLRAIWQRSRDKDDRIYYKDETQVMENFRGRTRLLGHLGQGNCTLEMTGVKDHDNGPFCFRIEVARTEYDWSTSDKFSFVDDCAELNMLPEPPKPLLSHLQTATEGEPFTITCSVIHTCPTHMPMLTWSRGTERVTWAHREIHSGVWESSSIFIIVPEEKDNHNDITCTAEFHGGMASTKKMTLFVKRSESYNQIIIPVAVGIGSAVIIGGLCMFMVKRYKNRIEELQNQQGSVWNRLSMLSRRGRV